MRNRTIFFRLKSLKHIDPHLKTQHHFWETWTNHRHILAAEATSILRPNKPFTESPGFLNIKIDSETRPTRRVPWFPWNTQLNTECSSDVAWCLVDSLIYSFTHQIFIRIYHDGFLWLPDLPCGPGEQGRHVEEVGSVQGGLKTPRGSLLNWFFPSINLFLLDSHTSTYLNASESLGGLCFLWDTALKTNVCGWIRCR